MSVKNIILLCSFFSFLLPPKFSLVFRYSLYPFPPYQNYCSSSQYTDKQQNKYCRLNPCLLYTSGLPLLKVRNLLPEQGSYCWSVRWNKSSLPQVPLKSQAKPLVFQALCLHQTVPQYSDCILCFPADASNFFLLLPLLLVLRTTDIQSRCV